MLYFNANTFLQLADEINFNDYQQPIPLATNRPPEGAYAVVSGWGLTSTPPSQLSNMQQFLFVKIIDTNTCREVYGDITTEICTLNNVNQGICSVNIRKLNLPRSRRF